jgi:hypothetical protein
LELKMRMIITCIVRSTATIRLQGGLLYGNDGDEGDGDSGR